MQCPACGEDAPSDAKWCEACGQDLAAIPLPVCVACGEREVGEDGYCLSCGHKQPAERDHMEFVDGRLAAVTDRGKRHRHNEDAVAIGTAADGTAVLVVCDGVSTTAGSAGASLAAAAAARDLIVAGLDGPIGEDGEPVPPLDAETLLVSAAEVAQGEASATDAADEDGSEVVIALADGGPPSSTFVAVVATPTVTGAELTTAWIGDSRAYWVGDDSTVLTGDDHVLDGSLVRWLGADSIDPTPEITSTTVSGAGLVVVCSDGLWRYAADAGELEAVIGRLQEDGRDGLALATALVDFANESGGHDNITVALWPSGSSESSGPSEQGEMDQQEGQA